MNTVCLKVDEAGLELPGSRTVWTRTLVIRILSYTMIGVMSLAVLLCLGILAAGLLHFVAASL